MLITAGDKLLINHRRLYDRDAERYFIGVVDAYEQGVVRITGYTWQHDALHGRLQRKEDKRCKIISLASGHVISYVLPSHLDAETLRIEQRKQHLVLVDGGHFVMDISDKLPTT